MAKARASLAAVGMAKLVDGRTSIAETRRAGDEVDILRRQSAACCVPRGEGPRRAASWAISTGLCAPPPETISWWIVVLGRTKRFRASTIVRAVKIVAVRTRSFGLA